MQANLSSERQRSMDPYQKTVTVHMAPGGIHDGAMLKALCGEKRTVNLDENWEIRGSSDYIVCTLC